MIYLTLLLVWFSWGGRRPLTRCCLLLLLLSLSLGLPLLLLLGAPLPPLTVLPSLVPLSSRCQLLQLLLIAQRDCIVFWAHCAELSVVARVFQGK